MATVVADSSSYAHVAEAVAAANAGDTVSVPAGSSTWATQLVITKSLYLIGNGVGSTNITSGLSAGQYLVTYRPANFLTDQPFRASGFAFDLHDSSHGIFLDGTRNAGTVLQKKCRIDHCKFTGASGHSLSYQAIHNGGMMGVVDNNTFDNIAYPVRNCWGPNPSNAWWNNWSARFLGTADNLYFEDNDFINVEVFMESQYGNRYACRYNNVSTWTASYPLLDIHGNQDAAHGDMISSFGAEVYGNNIADSSGMRLMDHRGGKLMLFLNNSTTPSWHIQVRDEYKDADNPTTNPEPQYVNDSYYFLNRRNLTGAAPTISLGTQTTNGALTLVPSANREYFVGTEPFDGTKGVGWGPLSARPVTCTKGVGYWATDQNTANLTGMVGKDPTTPISGTLYRAVDTNTWEAFYTPYTYPHPLRNEGGQMASKTISFNLVVTAASDFFLAVAPASLEIHPGNTATFTVSVTGAGGYSGQLRFTVTGVPTGCVATFAPATIGAGQSTVLTITTPAALALGSYAVTATATEV